MNYLKHVLRSALILLFLQQLWGCQQEIEEISSAPDSLAITSNSPLAAIIQQTTRNSGSYDSIIDHSSCVSIKFPFRVIVNGQAVVVESEADIDEVKIILDGSGGEEDSVEISFPVTVIFPDYTELAVNSEDELEDLVGECESEEHDAIECIDFEYPLHISIYDPNNQLSDVIVINSDKELYDFLEKLGEDDLVSFNYPITLVLSDGHEITVIDNTGLEDSIEVHSNDCYETKDPGDGEVDPSDSLFITALTAGHWEVSYFFDESDKTGNFAGFEFAFNEDSTAIASDSTTIHDGTWELYKEEENSVLNLDFGSDPPFDQLHEGWDIIEFDSEMIRLEHTGETDSAALLNLRKI